MSADVYSTVQWGTRLAKITDATGAVIFEQEVHAPIAWSDTAVSIVASKYFYGPSGKRERSIWDLIDRVSSTIMKWGLRDHYFDSEDEALGFYHRLTYLLLHQHASFNSPVWFNVGVPDRRGSGWTWNPGSWISESETQPQCSACFIVSVEDSLPSIMHLAQTEATIFKWGSGSGVNLSPIRESNAPLSGGGRASGPLSFMKGLDAFAGVIKSGGKTRRAAKMVVLDADHPDICEFITCKAAEERKAHALIAAGYSPSLDGEAYSSVYFQNANHSVRVTDEFMRLVEQDGDWELLSRVTKEPVTTIKARELFHRIAEAAWSCGDPGLQFHTATNAWHTCPDAGSIVASNPCSEFVFLNDTACNLASLNLLKFWDGQQLNTSQLCSAVDTLITAQEILVDRASYPTRKICENSHAYRPLGLGYANLGALLMLAGLPYASDEARTMAATITAIMTGEAYAVSARLAKKKGKYDGYSRACSEIVHKHWDAIKHVPDNPLITAARGCLMQAANLGGRYGYRNAQVTLIAPTGTIAFMMDCDTTGIEPLLALSQTKSLVGGGTLLIEPACVRTAREKYGNTRPGLFQTALGDDPIPWADHIKMMAAVQPFLSGAISKTVNMPANSTVEDIESAYRLAWTSGLKAIAVYRDGCKASQPLRPTGAAQQIPSTSHPSRRRLPDERRSVTHKFSIGGHEGYITAGMYDDGNPGEVFIRMAKEGSTLSGLVDAFAIAVSMSLQYGVPLRAITRKFQGMSFDPCGFTSHDIIKYAKSVVDYVAKWLELTFSQPEIHENTPINIGNYQSNTQEPAINSLDSPPCQYCGMLMERRSGCLLCTNCGATGGCA